MKFVLTALRTGRGICGIISAMDEKETRFGKSKCFTLDQDDLVKTEKKGKK